MRLAADFVSVFTAPCL